MKRHKSIEKFDILQKDSERGVKLLRTYQLETISQDKMENLLTCDFQQGNVGNCGLIAVLPALSKRPKFLTEIAPKIIKILNYSVKT